MQTILGAGGAIGTDLAKELTTYTKDIRLVGRNPKKVNETDELFICDLTDSSKVLHAVEGSKVVYLTAGFPYKTKVWQQTWPVVMKNVIEACKSHQFQAGIYRQYLHVRPDKTFIYDRGYTC